MRADAIYLALLLYSEAKEEIEGRRVSHPFHFEIVSFELVFFCRCEGNLDASGPKCQEPIAKSERDSAMLSWTCFFDVYRVS